MRFLSELHLGYKGAGILLFYETKNKTFILLGKRSFNPQKDYWSIPGGGFDEKKDRSFKDCAIREFNEEVRFSKNDLKGAKFWGESVVKYPLFEYKTYLVRLDTKPSNLPKFSREFRKMAFFSLQKLPQLTHFGVLKAVKENF